MNRDIPQVPTVWRLVGGAAVAVLTTIGAGWVLKRQPPETLRRLLGEETVPLPSLRILAACFLLSIPPFLYVGAIADMLAGGVAGAEESRFWTLTGIFALAWVAGFLTPGAPGGLGVREAILVAALDPIYGGAPALAVTVCLRLVTTAGDGTGFLAGLVAQRRFFPL